MVVELDGAGGHRGPRVADDELRDGDVERPLDDEGYGSALDRLGRERVAVVAIALDAEEERAGDDGARVVRELANVDGRRRGADDPCRSECRRDSLQVHAGRVYQGDDVFPRTPVRHRTVPFAGLFADTALAVDPQPGYARSGEEAGGPGHSSDLA